MGKPLARKFEAKPARAPPPVTDADAAGDEGAGAEAPPPLPPPAPAAAGLPDKLAQATPPASKGKAVAPARGAGRARGP